MSSTSSVAVTLAACVFVAAATFPRGAQAQNCVFLSGADCTSTECKINCPTTHDYVIFGQIYYFFFGVYYYDGVGFCQFQSNGSYSKGAFVTSAYRTIDTALWTLRADGGDQPSSGGNDVVRLADPQSYEACGDTAYFVRGGLPAGDQYLFWGDRGNDKLYLCDQINPSATDCIFQSGRTDGGRADGRGGNDFLYGSVLNDRLWGGDGYDDLYGYAGSDTMYGGTNPDGAGLEDWLFGGDGHDTMYGDANPDLLYGGAGSDSLYGGTGNDDLRGETDCDTLDGGDGSDGCLCGATNTFGEGFPPTACERFLDRFLSHNCPGCLI